MMSASEEGKLLKNAHKDLDVEKNLEILFAGAHIGQAEFLPLYRACLADSGTTVGSWKSFRRAQRALTLGRYFDHSLSIAGSRIECGALLGFSSLMMSRIAKMRDDSFNGTDFHIVDSFEGLSAPVAADAYKVERLPAGDEQPVYSHHAGHFAVPLDHVQSVMADFPDTNIHKGWIPDVFSELPETTWSFVHIDVDLYEPTKACLEYFLPRLVPGGVIVNDDFGSPLFPGGGLSWREVMEDRGLSYAILDTGQSVYINQPAAD